MIECKVCTKCKQEKPVDQFRFANKALNKRHIWCKVCFSNHEKSKWYGTDPTYREKRTNLTKQRNKINRDFILEYKNTHPCEDCGISDYRVLEFDHIDPSTKSHNIGEMIHKGLALTTIKEEVAKCRVLCANCHRIRTWSQNGYRCI